MITNAAPFNKHAASLPDRNVIFWPTVTGFSTIALIAATIIGWSANAPLASSIIATGTVVSSESIKSVQSLEGGVVKTIFVTDGERVKAGDLLLRLDGEPQVAAIASIKMSLALNGAQQARLQSEINQLPKVTFPREFHGIALRDYKPVLAEQQAQFDGRMHSYFLKQREIALEIGSLRDAQGAMARQTTELQSRLKLQETDLAAAFQLEQHGSGSKKALRDAEASLAALRGAAAELEGRQSDLRQQEGHERFELEQAQLSLREADEPDLQKLEGEAEELLQRLQQAQFSLTRASIVSPANGVVMGLNVHTVGGVIAPGSLIMEVAPTTDQLLVEAEIRPMDINDVSIGASVTARVLNERFASTASLMGKVTYVSPDKLINRERNESYFLVRVAIDQARNSRSIQTIIRPGQPMQLMILKQPTTLLSYLLSPLAGAMTKAMRE